MALFDVPMVPRDGAITLSDATGTPIVATIAYEEGDFSFDEISADNWDTEVFFDRGVPYAIRNVIKRLFGFQFTAHATDFTDATEKTLLDAVRKKGAFASGVSTKGASYDVWLLKTVFTAEQSNYGASADSVLTLNHCWLKAGFSEGVPGKFSVKGIAIPFADTDIAMT